MKKIFKALALSAVVALTLTACSKTDSVKSKKVDKIHILQGNEQCALPGEKFNKLLRLELLGEQEAGLLGGKGRRPPVSKVEEFFVPVDGSDLKLSKTSAVSDAGGSVCVQVRAGKRTGDQYLKVIAKDKSTVVRFITGISITGETRNVRPGS